MAQKTGENLPTVLYSLNKLISIGLVEKRTASLKKKTKRKRSMF
ncbi:MAG: hypothetical protein LUC90_11980 [Lachnospiraceae bacterium]|nr:hypothetical protein [Lachnospiraceae bacterium]